jgi:muramoyltetrapeptide carboxypeptidase
MPSLRKPRAIKKGARVGIAAPAGPVNPESLEAGIGMLRKLGFEPVAADDLTRRKGYLAGDDERRAQELMGLIRDPEIDAILCARGGYGCHRIMSQLDPVAVRKAAKPLMGYSDITTLLLWQRRAAGLMGFHGPMLERPEELSADARRAMVAALQGIGPPAPLVGKALAGGWGEGRLTGGSLALVVASLGTPWEIDTQDAILLLEEVNEAPFRLDRMLQQLRAAGKLDGLVGVGVGSLTDCGSELYPTPTPLEVIEEILEPLGIPIVAGLPFGHCADNHPWPLGARAAIDGGRGEIELLELGVAKR